MRSFCPKAALDEELEELDAEIELDEEGAEEEEDELDFFEEEEEGESASRKWKKNCNPRTASPKGGRATMVARPPFFAAGRTLLRPFVLVAVICYNHALHICIIVSSLLSCRAKR